MKPRVRKRKSQECAGGAGDKLNLSGSCPLVVTSVAVSGQTYTVTFTLEAVTDVHRQQLALNGQDASYFSDDILESIEIGGTLASDYCFSPLLVRAPPGPRSSTPNELIIRPLCLVHVRVVVVVVVQLHSRRTSALASPYAFRYFCPLMQSLISVP
jgi:hypothetical protein